MINFAARGQGMKLVIDEKFLAKKIKISKFWTNSMLCTLKESLEHVEFRFSLKKFDFLKKKQFFQFFKKKFEGGIFWCQCRKNIYLMFVKDK